MCERLNCVHTMNAPRGLGITRVCGIHITEEGVFVRFTVAVRDSRVLIVDYID